MTLNECYIEIPGLANSLGFRIKIFESEVNFTHRDFFEHKHSDFEISFIKSGRGVYQLKDRICEFNQGDIFIFGTNVIHCITDTYDEEKTNLINIQFEPRLIWSPFSNLLTDECRKVFNGKNEKITSKNDVYDDISSIILKIQREATHRNVGYEILIRAYLCEIIGLLVRESEPNSRKYSIDTQRDSLLNLDLAMTYINENLDNTIVSLKDIEECVSIIANLISRALNRVLLVDM